MEVEVRIQVACIATAAAVDGYTAVKQMLVQGVSKSVVVEVAVRQADSLLGYTVPVRTRTGKGRAIV